MPRTVATARNRQRRAGMEAAKGSLAQAVRFDPLRRAASPRMREAVAAITAAVEAHDAEHRPRQRARGPDKLSAYRAAVEAITCNLAGLALDPHGRPLAVPRSSGVMWSGTRYAEPVYGRHFLQILDDMAHPALGLVEDLQRGFSFGATGSAPSTIRPGPRFGSYVEVDAVGWAGFRRLTAAEVIVLKAELEEGQERTDPIDYQDHRFADECRAELQEINEWLCRASFWLLPDEEPAPLNREPIDPTRRALRRVFTGGTKPRRSGERAAFQVPGGGRLYDGFWIDMPKAERFQRLRIASAAHPEGEAPAAVDMKYFNPRIAYAREVSPVLAVPEGDLYDILGDGSYRNGFKKLLNAMLSAGRPLRGWPPDVQAEFPPGTKLQDVIREVERRHAPIAHLFGTGLGARLAAIESTIVVDALRRLLRQGVTALPVHDALWCAKSEVVRASDALTAASIELAPEFRVQLSIELAP